MSTPTSGLTRRRGAGGGGGGNGAGAATVGEDEPSASRIGSPPPKTTAGGQDPITERSSYNSSAGENGHKIAYDPRDISESAERSKQPKLTLMEEILLLGLKDKQVIQDQTRI